MKISELIIHLQTVKRDKGDLDVALSNDEEGNEFHDIYLGFGFEKYVGKEYVTIYPGGESIEWD